MVGQTRVLLLVPFELLFLPSFHAAVNFFRRTVGSLIKSLNHKEVRVMPYILRVNGVARALAERKEINGIQQVSLSHSVLSEKGIQLRREREFHLLQILIIEYGYTLQYHMTVYLCFSTQR